MTLYTNDGFPLTAQQRELLQTRKVAVRDERLARLEGPGESLERLVFTLAARLGCRLLEDGKVEVNEFGQTTRPGVYAVGDMARRAANPFTPQQLVAAAAEGAAAAVVIDQELLYDD